MNRLPKVIEGDRIADTVFLPLMGVAQAVAIGIGAFATRDAFTALHAGMPPDLSTLTRLFLAGFVAAGLEYLLRMRAEALGQSYAAALRLKLFDHISGMPRRALETRRLGGLSLRFVGDLSTARNWFGQGLPGIISAIAILPGAAFVLWLLSPALALASVLPLSLSLIGMALAALGLEARHRRLRSKRANISIQMMERIAISPELDLIGRTDKELRELDKNSKQLRQDAMARLGLSGTLRLFPQIGAACAGCAVFGVAGGIGVAPGVVAASLAVLALLAAPLLTLAEAWDQFCAWRIARQKLETLLSQPSKRRIVVAIGHAPRVSISGSLVEREVQAGATVLIDGLRGAGKSRLASVLAGLDDDAQINVRFENMAGRQPKTAYIGANPVTLQGSLRRALTLGHSSRPDRIAVRDAARDFGLRRLLRRIGGTNGRIAEGGRNLSVGESLRFDFARALLGQPDLIVIDTSRFWADPNHQSLFQKLRDGTDATIFVTGPPLSDLHFDTTINLSRAEQAAA
ncbi:MAG: ABC transporter ATP-binding protein [Pseudomonadota bacterium]